jgi:hypothetical protein
MAVVKERPTIEDEKGEGAEDSSPKAAIQASLEDIRNNQREKEARKGNEFRQGKTSCGTDHERRVHPRGQPRRHPTLTQALPIPHPFNL